MRVLVCGSRTFRDADIVGYILRGFWFSADGAITVIEGGANGADTIGRNWAYERRDDRDIRHEEYRADWSTCAGDCPFNHRKVNRHGVEYCPTAGHRRNQQMLDEGKPGVVVAFVDKPLAESRGTADMVRRARAAGVTTYVVEAHHGS